MEPWRTVFRLGFAKVASTGHLEALRTALETDDPKLSQGATTTPPPLNCVLDWPCEAACMLGYCAWKSDDLQTVGEVEMAFARMCQQIDQELAEPGACRYLIEYFDDDGNRNRADVFANLLDEVNRELANRECGPLVAVADGSFAGMSLPG